MTLVNITIDVIFSDCPVNISDYNSPPSLDTAHTREGL